MNKPVVPKLMVAKNHVAVFNDRKIRRVFIDDAWWFSVVDVIQALTDSTNPRDYWYKMKLRVKNEDNAELSTFCRQLKLESSETEIVRNKDAKGFGENKVAASAGGKIAGNARKELEKESGKKVSTSSNYLELTHIQIKKTEVD